MMNKEPMIASLKTERAKLQAIVSRYHHLRLRLAAETSNKGQGPLLEELIESLPDLPADYVAKFERDFAK